MNWKTVPLGDILTEATELAELPSPDRRITVRLNVKGVEKRPASNDKAGATRYFVRRAGQFIYGRQNLHKGAFGIVPPELDGYESSQDLPAFDIDSRCEPAWLLYFLRQGNFYESLDSIARGIGSRRVNPKDLYLVEIPLPPLAEQQEILRRLTDTDEAAESLSANFDHQATLLTRLRQAILREAVQGRLLPQDPADEPAAALLTRIRAEKQRLVKEKKLRPAKPLPPLTEAEVPYEVPQGWAWVRLGTVLLTLQTGPFGSSLHKHDYVLGGTPVINPANIKEGVIYPSARVTVNRETVNRLSTFLLKTGDIIMGRRGEMGRCALITEKENDWLCGTGSLILRFSEVMHTEYTELCFRTPLMKAYLESASVGATMQNLNQKALYNAPFPLPPLAEQQRIVAKVTELLAQSTALEAELDRARAAAAALHAAALREAFAGPVPAAVAAA